ncbi:low affinity immunoglobulin epsilon Fc receptor-like [Drosophila subpulchrella]|uniref:low affinity immunoglobulin epsilon Fc receptor-like n=1 Tax=Drosophila subpulchrella TaxID=1486046 RepID=UPI0018A127A3|nr:low affinity immunoglobulin epsilon Fc receptor-like [Drosophila subpulchrella]
MLKIKTCILMAFIAWNLNVSQAKSLNSEQKRKHTRLADISPSEDHVGNQLGPDVLRTVLSKLDLMEGKLTGLKDFVEGLSRIEDQHRDIRQSILDQSAAQFNDRKRQLSLIEGKMGNPQEALLEIGNKISQELVKPLRRLGRQQTDMETKLENLQRVIVNKITDQHTSSPQIKRDIPQHLKGDLEKMENSVEIMQMALTSMAHFVRIGTRYFYIETKVKQNWLKARNSCRDLGGYLASIKSKEELDELDTKLIKPEHYWLGINDRDNEGVYVSDASRKKATFLPWQQKQPDNFRNNEDCINISSIAYLRRSMNDLPCEEEHYFICQFDNEI